MALDILIVDDERDIRDLVAGVLSDEGYGCRTAGDSTAALAAVDERRPSLVLLDVWLHGSPMDGLEVLDEIKKREPELPVIIFSGHGNIDTAVSAIGRGAMDFLEKPFEAERLLLLVERATATERLRRENARLRQGFAMADAFTGNSSAINQIRATLKRVANTGSRLLITGPAGSGKEVAARLLHSWSARADHAFVTVNSARITPERFDSVVRGGRMDCGFYQTFMRWTLEGDRDAHKFTIRNAFKDMRYLESMADAAGIANPVGNAVKNSYGYAVAAGKADHYVPMLASAVAIQNGLDDGRG